MTPAEVEEANLLLHELRSLKDQGANIAKVSDFQLTSTGTGSGYITTKTSDFGDVTEQLKDVLIAYVDKRKFAVEQRLVELGVEVEAKLKQATRGKTRR